MTEPQDRVLDRYEAYLECRLSDIELDPRLWRRFGWSDVVNHTLLEAYHDLEKLQALNEADRNRCLRRMLRNNLLERIEHERAQARDFRREVALERVLSDSSGNLPCWLVDSSAGPAGHVEAVEQEARLADALAQLPQREREALILQQYHGWTLAEIAEHLDCTSGAVAGLHARALKRLRHLLRPSADWS